MTYFKLLSKSQGMKEITYRDEYINLMKPYERSLKMDKVDNISIKEYTDYLATTVMDFSTNDKLKLEKALLLLNEKITNLNISNPDKILLVKTNGLDEWNSAYTRRNIIFLPEKKLKYNVDNLFKLLAHEFFHIYSRVSSQKRNQLYNSLNFKLFNKEIPNNVRTLTNPDTLTQVITTINYKDTPIKVTPIITADKIDSTNDILNSIKIKLYCFDLKRVINIEDTDYLKLVRNATNPQHPDEILAENFTHLVNDKNVKDRKLIDKIEEIISNE